MLVRRKNITRYCQEFDNEESEDSDEEEKWRPKKKEIKDHFETYRKGLYCQNCYNERHFTKECVIEKFYKICKKNDHNTYQCPNKVVDGKYPSREIVPMHVV
jgi:hypothetical protein